MTTCVAQLGPSHRSRILAPSAGAVAEDDRRLQVRPRDQRGVDGRLRPRYPLRPRCGLRRRSTRGPSARIRPSGLERPSNGANSALSVSRGQRDAAASASSCCERAGEHARNRGQRVMTMVYMPENTALAALAHRAGMHIVCEPSECRAPTSVSNPARRRRCWTKPGARPSRRSTSGCDCAAPAQPSHLLEQMRVVAADFELVVTAFDLHQLAPAEVAGHRRNRVDVDDRRAVDLPELRRDRVPRPVP